MARRWNGGKEMGRWQGDGMGDGTEIRRWDGGREMGLWHGGVTEVRR